MFFFFQAEDGIRDLVRSRGLGDVYKRQVKPALAYLDVIRVVADEVNLPIACYNVSGEYAMIEACLLYTSDAADERSSVDLGGRRIIKKKKNKIQNVVTQIQT